MRIPRFRSGAVLLCALGACGKPVPTLHHVSAVDRSYPTRVVVLGPSTVENLVALGLADRLVGVSDYCVEPAAKGLPRVGGQIDPALERIAALRPDLVIVQGRLPELGRWCERAGVAFLPLHTDRWSSWLEELRTLGNRFGVPDRAAALAARAEAELADLRDRVPTDRRPARCLLVVGRRAGEASGLVVAGGRSFLSELLTAAGGDNVFADNDRDYFDLNEEALVRAAPEVIFELVPGSKEDPLPLWRHAFPSLPAVREGRVRVLCQPFVLLPGPRMIETARLFRKGLFDQLTPEVPE